MNQPFKMSIRGQTPTFMSDRYLVISLASEIGLVTTRGRSPRSDVQTARTP